MFEAVLHTVTGEQLRFPLTAKEWGDARVEAWSLVNGKSQIAHPDDEGCFYTPAGIAMVRVEKARRDK